jgi:hypothetical protein
MSERSLKLPNGMVQNTHIIELSEEEMNFYEIILGHEFKAIVKTLLVQAEL